MSKIDFIAEISSNHNRDLDRCKKFIKKAYKIGCTGVKFQLFKIEELFAPEILQNSDKHSCRKEWELPYQYIPELSNYARKLGLSFGCTPFYLEAIEILKPYVDYYKISSYELLWHPLIQKCADTGKPIVISTGMAKLVEVKDTLKLLIKTKCKDITILQCTSAYPTPITDVNLKVINTFKEFTRSLKHDENIKFNFGYSDHSVSSAVIYRAIHKYDASFIELHIDLDGEGVEYSAGHCWLPDEIKTLIKTVNEGLLSDGIKEKLPTETELSDRSWRADPCDGLRPMKAYR